MFKRSLLWVGIAALAGVAVLVGCSDSRKALEDISSAQHKTLSGDNATPVFEADLRLLQRPANTPSDVVIAANPDRIALFGDLHVHTENSFDAFTFGSIATPEDAYRYARGEAIDHPMGYTIALDRPLDFYAVTDHAMLLGVAKQAADTGTEISRLPPSEALHNFNAEGNRGVMSLMERGQAFGQYVPKIVELIRSGDVDKELLLDVGKSTWEQTVDATDAAYEPGRFTSFAAYEYTAATDKRDNLHRNVIFKDTEHLPAYLYSRLHSQNPEGLWRWMDDLRALGVESLAIPHNSNGSNGEMFKQIDWSGKPIDEAYAQTRLRNEPLVEITQIKGTSETHPVLSDTDEWAGFELMEYRIGSRLASTARGSYVRDALRSGLEMDAAGQGNPYRFGFIGSTDTHVGGGALREDKFFSKIALMDGSAERRGSVPANWFIGKVASLMSDTLVKDVDGKTYMAMNVFEYWGASGLAAVWAESNTREAIYDALRRKETFATSGPRIKVRFFAGFDYEANLIDSPELTREAYAGGVTMGGELHGQNDSAPRFLVWAMADTTSAPLDRVQIVKGWEQNGITHEQVFDVACSEGEVDPTTQRCSDNGAWVSAEDCSISSDIGAAELRTLWNDPQFDPQQNAFYYVRVLENPTCRWSTWDALRAGVEPRSDLPRTLQERAWSSPIWYRP